MDIKKMAATGKGAYGSMGNDVPVAVLSRKPYRLFKFFKHFLHRLPIHLLSNQEELL